MISKTIKCPNCGYQETIQGHPGEEKQVSCPKCGNKGKFTFENKIIQKKSKGFFPTIEVNNLVKTYNGINAVNNISFKVRKGEIFGFLGPNGAGKTTTIKSILGLININSGNIKIEGFDIKHRMKKAKANLGYLPEKVAFYNNLTALQNLNFYAEMKKVSKDQCKPLIEDMGLKGVLNKKVGKFSKGMVQRLGMARALLGNPPIVILDEPSGGLDPRGVALIREKIRLMQSEGCTVFVSSHILSEIQEVCTRVAIINNGNLVADDSVANLGDKLRLKPKMVIELEKINEKIVESVKSINGVDKVEVRGKNLEVFCDPIAKSKIVINIDKNGGNILDIRIKDPSLEEVFMKYTEA